MTGTLERYPGLADWLGDRTDHPVRRMLDDGRWPPAVTDRVYELARAIEAAAPPGWEGKQREFQQLPDRRALWSLRVELLVAAALIRAGVSFEFGFSKPDVPWPDLIVNDPNLVGPGRSLGIEVTVRAPFGPWALVEELEDALADANLAVVVTLDYHPEPVLIPRAARTAIVNKTVAVARRGDGSFTRRIFEATDDRPALDVTVAVRAGALLPDGPQVQLPTFFPVVPLSEHMDHVGLEVQDALKDERKWRQAEAMPTVLVVDVARVGRGGFIRPARVWAQLLPEIVPEGYPFIATVPLVHRPERNDMEWALTVQSGAPAGVLDMLSNVTGALGLPPTT